MPEARVQLAREYTPFQSGGPSSRESIVSPRWLPDSPEPRSPSERSFGGHVSLTVSERADASCAVTLRLSCTVVHGDRALAMDLDGTVDPRSGEVTLVGRLPAALLGAGGGRRSTPITRPSRPGAADRARIDLTRRESDVAHLLARGERNAQIAAILRISPHTARRHTETVMLKLGVHSRAAVGAALRGERA